MKITKELINIYPESITVSNDVGNMPLHEIVKHNGSLEVVKYLTELHQAIAFRQEENLGAYHFILHR